MKDTKTLIVEKATKLAAEHGYEGIHMRSLAQEVGIAPSVLYHYFADKDVLLKQIFDQTNTALGVKRKKLPACTTASDMLRQRISFQLDNAQAIVFVLKFYLAKRKSFPKLANGFVPDKAYLHIEEVLRFGVETGEFFVRDIKEDAKVITHAINGFVLEYYPAKLRKAEKEQLVDAIHSFLLRALRKEVK